MTYNDGTITVPYQLVDELVQRTHGAIGQMEGTLSSIQSANGNLHSVFAGLAANESVPLTQKYTNAMAEYHSALQSLNQTINQALGTGGTTYTADANAAKNLGGLINSIPT